MKNIEGLNRFSAEAHLTLIQLLLVNKYKSNLKLHSLPRPVEHGQCKQQQQRQKQTNVEKVEGKRES